MTRRLTASKHLWLLQTPLAVAREVRTSVEVIVVRLEDGAHTGRGEGRGVSYHGETPGTMLDQVESVRGAIESGAGREDLLTLLPAGGARNALDAALWDLEARQTGVRVWERAGLSRLREVTSAISIGIRSIEGYEKRARELSSWPWIRIEVEGVAALEAVAAVRRGAPTAHLIVDAQQTWSMARLRQLASPLAASRVELLEQPIPGEADASLRAGRLPIAVCADESANTAADLPRLVGRYDFVNIKLDKAGGLTAALDFARQARRAGLKLMVGCMSGSSLAMAPAMVLAQLCEIVNLEGPLRIAGDWADGIAYRHGRMEVPRLWG